MDKHMHTQIFSQDDVIAYLERKGLSEETIKRLQIFNKNKKQQYILPKHNQHHRTKKSAKYVHTKAHTHDNIKYVSSSINKYVFPSFAHLIIPSYLIWTT